MHRPPSSPPSPRNDDAGARSDVQPAAPAADGPAIDAATFDRLRELDPDGQRGFLQQVLQTYARTLDRQLGVLGDAASVGDVARAGEVAHALKSSSASVGALVLSSRCAVLERLARGTDPQTLGEPLRALLAEAARVRAAVQAMLSS